MMWMNIACALYFVPMAVVLITAAAHREHNDANWYNMMGWLSITPVVNILIMGSIISWYFWKGYHKLFDKKK